VERFCGVRSIFTQGDAASVILYTHDLICDFDLRQFCGDNVVESLCSVSVDWTFSVITLFVTVAVLKHKMP